MLLAADEISKKYADKVLLNSISFYLQEGDKVGIIGVNGTGKSTLLKILSQKESPDQGKVTVNSGVRVEYLAQNPEWDNTLTILEQVFEGANAALKDTKEFEAKAILNKLGLSDYNKRIGELSGGQKKRLALAEALVHPSEVLLLDEPTNHLDNQMILWLENYLIKFSGAIIMVTHDRYFLDRVTQRIVELDQGNLYNYQGNYSEFLKLKSQRQEMELASNRKAKSLLRRELEWMQQGPKARGTKSKDRMLRFEELKEKSQISSQDKLEVSSMASRLGKKIIEIEHVCKSYGNLILVKDFSYFIRRDSRIGIIGDNGRGKSTLLNLICGNIAPDTGAVVRGDTVKIGYFTQESRDMDISLKVIDYIRNISDVIETPEGTFTASKMLERFLFPPSLQWNTISRLSGGERRRLYLLSILMAAPNVLILDEPTNDLDIETLTILEDYLEHFVGPILTVSHDRYFLDKVVEEIWAFDENGTILQYTGNYKDYLEKIDNQPAKINQTTNALPKPSRKRQKKLAFTFQEQRDYETIDERIQVIEDNIKDIDCLIQQQATDYVKLQELMAQKLNLEQDLEAATERWIYLQELEEKISKDQEV